MTSQPADADQGLLLGILAVQSDLISRRDLAAAVRCWAAEPSRTLGRVLLDQGALTPSRLALLEALVQEHPAAQGVEAARAPAARECLETVGGPGPSAADPDRTQPPALKAGDADPYATRAEPLPPPAPALRFRRLRPHAKGGLGEVFVAFDVELHREVALKEIRDRHADDPSSRARFLLEAEITGGLEHPGIVPVYSLGAYPDGRPYYAMRFIRGDTLKEVIDRFHASAASGRDPGERALELRRLLRCFLDVCNAVAYAHSRGIIHRDLKPGNVLIGKFGETLVVDWGLAKPVDRAEIATLAGEQTLTPSSGSGTVETVAGSAIGTPAFMSPEQAAGRLDLIGPASDVYSLGATLFDLLTGQPPFAEAELGEVLQKVQRGDFPPPCRVLGTVPRALEAVCLKAMAREPAERYASPRALADDLEHWLADEPVSAWHEPWNQRLARWASRHRTWVQAGAAALLLVALVAVAASVVINAARHQEQAERRLAEQERRKAERLSAWLALDRGLAYFERGSSGRGLVRIAQSLELTSPDDAMLRRAILANLAAWRHPLHPLRMVFSPAGMVQAVAFSPDGATLLTGGSALVEGSVRGETRLWDAASGRPLEPTFWHEGAITCVAVSPDGRTVLTASEDRTALLWDAATGRRVGRPIGHQGSIRGATFRPDGRAVATGSDDGTARLWDAATGEPAGPPLEHPGAVRAVAFRPDGKQLLTAGDDGTARLWDPAAGTPASLHLAHPGPVLAVTFSPDGASILTGTADGQARLWDATTGELRRPPIPCHTTINALAFRPDGAVFLTGGDDNMARLWDAHTGEILGLPLEHRGSVHSVAFRPDGQAVLTGSGDGLARLWDAATSPAHPSFEHPEGVEAVAWSPDGRLVATAGLDHTARLWEIATGEPVGRPLQHPGPVTAVAFHPDGRVLLTGDRDGTARLWAVDSGQPRGEPLRHPAAVLAVAFRPDGRAVLTGSSDGVARLWDANSGRPLGPSFPHQWAVTAVAFAPDGRTVLTAGGTLAQRWDAASGRPLGPPLQQLGPIQAAAFSPDGQLILTGGEDNVGRLWDAASGRPLGRPVEHRDTVRAVAFSPDGTILLTGGHDRTAQLWDTATCMPIGPPLRHPAPVTAVAFRRDGQAVLTGSLDPTLQVWPVMPPMAGDVERITLWTHVLTGLFVDTRQSRAGLVRVLDQRAWLECRDRLRALGGPPLPTEDAATVSRPQ